ESSKWEVINDEEPWDHDDFTSQDDLLSDEELIPFKASRPKPKPRPAAADNSHKPAERHGDTRAQDKVAQAILPPIRDPVGGRDLDEEHLLPLGVQGQGGRRRLLQAVPLMGPRLPPELELKRLPRLGSEAVNLSTACKETDDDDCLFDVEKLLADELAKASKDLQPDLYTPNEEKEVTGVYPIEGPAPLSVNYTGSNSQLTDEEADRYKKEMRKELKEVFKNIPNSEFRIEEPTLENGKVSANWTLLVDGGTAANQWGTDNVEEELIKALNNSIPAFNNMKIDNVPIEPTSRLESETFIDRVRSSLNNYCENTLHPCGKEYDSSRCVNTGFMSGSCPHKCTDYGCQNGAVCELNDNYSPRCICGSWYRGKFCEIKRNKEKTLSTPETVGVAVGAGILGCGVLSCCCWFLVCRKKSDRNVLYTYYEDEEQFDHVSDPTSIANYYIDRPMISTAPISVFNSNAGFEA
ncbi:hypothetical protein BaRGS_00002006, partial [Batillaria attramentaria]